MPLSVTVGKELEQRLHELSEITQRPKSFYVREALLAYMELHEKELLEKHTYIATRRSEAATLTVSK